MSQEKDPKMVQQAKNQLNWGRDDLRQIEYFIKNFEKNITSQSSVFQQVASREFSDVKNYFFKIQSTLPYLSKAFRAMESESQK